jgi:hypothetical protein
MAGPPESQSAWGGAQMKMQKSSQHPIDTLLKQTLKDDLPPEMERRLKIRLRQFLVKTEKHERSQFNFSRNVKNFFVDRILEWKWGGHYIKSAALTFAAVTFIVLLAAAILVPVTGSPGLLAESFSTLTTSLYVSQQISRVIGMQCFVEAVTGQGETLTYSIKWTPDRTRVQFMNPEKFIVKTLLVENGHATIIDKTNNAVRYGKGLEYMDDLQFQPIIDFLSPVNLKESLQGKWRPGSDRQQGDCGEDTFSLVNRGEKGAAEVWVDMCTFLPVRMIKYHPNPTHAGKGKEIAMSVDFIWQTPFLPRVIDQKPQ